MKSVADQSVDVLDAPAPHLLWRDTVGHPVELERRLDSLVQLAPPLIADQQIFDDIEQILRAVITEAGAVL